MKDLVQSNLLQLEGLEERFKMRIPFVQEKINQMLTFLPNIDIQLYFKLTAEQRKSIIEAMKQHSSEQKRFQVGLAQVARELSQEEPSNNQPKGEIAVMQVSATLTSFWRSGSRSSTSPEMMMRNSNLDLVSLSSWTFSRSSS